MIDVLHCAAEHDADDDPDRAGQKAELRRERGADQRTGAGDGGEVMAEQRSTLVGTKSRPLFSRSAGVARWSSSPNTVKAR